MQSDASLRSFAPSTALTLRSSLLGALGIIAIACGGNAPPAEPPPTETPAPAAANEPVPSGEPEPELSPEAAALIAESEGKEPPAPSAPTKSENLLGGSDNSAGHELTYRVKSDSLLIQVAGGSFLPRAKSKKLGKGYGIEIELEAKSDAGVVLAQSDSGPMALAAHIAGKNEVIGDKKSDAGDKTVTTPMIFRRSWPSDEASALKPGDIAEIQVGLWGLGTSADSKKPVRRFFVINVKVDQKGATVTVAPPKGTGK